MLATTPNKYEYAYLNDVHVMTILHVKVTIQYNIYGMRKVWSLWALTMC